MTFFPPCKINLGLHVLAKRSDGYHSIETGFYQVPWTDVLDITPADEFSFECSGISLPGQKRDNICVKAWELLSQTHAVPPVRIHLHKEIPTGAGLGGGSSDGAFTLKALDKIFALGLKQEQLKQYASMLGSDCPFFLENRPCIGRGRGEILDPFALDLKGKFLMVAKPDVHVSTADAYGLVTPDTPSVDLRAILLRPLTEWKGVLVNDFEKPVIAKYPEIGRIKKKMYDLGAVYAGMSGSGAAVFGIFTSLQNAALHFPSMQRWSGELS